MRLAHSAVDAALATDHELVALARSIDTEDEWRRLLDTARTEEERAAWVQALSPHLAFRIRICQTPGCDSGLPAVWQPVLIAKHDWQSEALYVPVELRYCGRCRLNLRVMDFMTDDLWTQVITACVRATEPVPQRRLTELTFIEH